jgi:orotidine-5'-phosphate decarboxylase
MQPAVPARDRLIVGLDLPSVGAAEAMIARLGDSVTFYKIGYQLAYAGGLPLVPQLVRAGKKVFIDLKLHDIGNTVARGVESVAGLGASFLTIHAYPQTMKAAVEGRAGSDLKIRGPSRPRCSVSMAWCVRRKRPAICANWSATKCSW